MIPLERYHGCLLGLALGDAMGAPFEGGPLERLLWRMIGTTRAGEARWTDDTQMSLDLAESLAIRGTLDPDDLAQRFAAGYRWTRGYGPGTAKVLKRIAKGADWQAANRSVHPNGSLGNGASMRSPVVGLFFATQPAVLVDAARRAAQITHSHPLGIEGAVLVAVATAHAGRRASREVLLDALTEHCTADIFRSRVALIRDWLSRDSSPDVKQVRQQLGNGITAINSCITSIYCALRYADAPFEKMHSYIVGLGGDVDTIGAMAGAIWGAANGADALPSDRLATLEQRQRIVATATALHARAAI